MLTVVWWVMVLAATGECARKVWIDNDSLTSLSVSIPLLSGMDIVGITGSFGSYTLNDALGMTSSILSNYSLSDCIPVYAGASKPLLRDRSTFDIWQELYGEFVWKGAWDPEYESIYNTTTQVQYNRTLPGAMALINAVKQYPGEVEIYAAGLMTTLAQAVGLWPEMVNLTKAVWIMGGYIDNQWSQLLGSNNNYDINTDINFMMDPEAAQIVLTAGFPRLYLGGNVTNYVYPTQDLMNRLVQEFGPAAYETTNISTVENSSPNPLALVEAFVGNGNATDVTLPLWDEVVSAFMAFPDLITEQINLSAAVDTTFASPSYGKIRIWPSDLAPKRGPFGNVTYVASVNQTALMDKVYAALSTNWSTYCGIGRGVPY